MLAATAGMTTARWMTEVPVVELPICWLTPTQEQLDPALVLAAIKDPTRSHCGDPYPHVVLAEATMWIEDGHHRVVAARMTNRRTVHARLLVTT